MKRFIPFLVCVFALTLSAQTPLTADGLAGFIPKAAAGGGNNAAIVPANFIGMGTGGNVASITGVLPSSVTSGNSVIVCCVKAGGTTPVVGDLTKTGGTATIGTIALDKLDSGSNPFVGIYRIPITGSGTLTVAFSAHTGTDFMLGAATEVTGLAAAPLAENNIFSGTGTTHTTGSVTPALPGIMFYVASENAAGDFTRTYSDQLIFKIDTASSTLTGIIQYKIVSASPNTMTDQTGSDSSAWAGVYCVYKSN